MSDAVLIAFGVCAACVAMVLTVCVAVLIGQAAEKRYERWLRGHKGDGRG